MSTYDRPINYDRDVIMDYDRNLVDDNDYITERENILNNKLNKEHNIKIEGNNYNPLFTPEALIQNQFNKSRTNTIKTEEFDPYLNFLKKKGLNQENIKVRYNINYINIDSLNRNTIPVNLPLHIYDLDVNPLSIVNTKLQIKLSPNQIANVNVGDKFSLTNIQSFVKIYSAFDESNNTILSFIKNKSYIQININANINTNDTLNLYQKYFDTKKLFVTISGIQGVNINSYFEVQNNNPYNSTANNIYSKLIQYTNDQNISYIGNIPVSFINDQHQIYLLPPNDSSVIFDPNKFYILLPFASDGTNIITTNQSNNYNITFTFKHYNFIPLNEIEADYPINSEHVKGFHIIKSINYTNNYVTTDIYPPIDTNFLNDSIYNYYNFGGNSVYFNLIDKVQYAYPNQNNYTLNLNKVYNNVVEIKLIDSMFINPAKTFYNTGVGKNNRIYFQNIENIENIQFIELDEGLYTYDTIISSIEKKFSQLSRNINPINFGYDLKYNVNVSINKDTQVISFISYKSKTLPIPINNVDPVINVNDNGIGIGTYTIVIDHLNHNISVNSITALFSGFIDHLGIPASFLNTTHTITIIDSNRYSFVINNVNLNSTKFLTNGGRNVTVFIPSEMKFYFNYPDTAGTVLGFRNPNFATSITNYSYIIKNSDPYLNEISADSNGDSIVIKNNSIKLYKFTYFLINCTVVNLSSIVNLLSNANTKNNLFAKCRITGDKIIVNEKVDTSLFFYDPIYELNQLSFTFYNPDNTLVDFNDNDHSFVLQITTLDNTPELTNINSSRSLVK